MIIIYIEDPGAKTMLVPFLRYLLRKKQNFQLFCSPNIIKMINEFELKEINKYNNTSNYAKSILSNRKINYLIVGTSENTKSFSLKLISEAKRNKILSIGAVDSPANSEYRFKGLKNDPLYYVPNYLWVPDKRTRKEFLKLKFPKKYILDYGHPYYWEMNKKYKQVDKEKIESIRRNIFKETSSKKKIILFLGEKSEGLDNKIFLANKEYTLKGTSGSVFRTHIILEELLLATKKLKDINIYVKPHPKENYNDYQNYSNAVNFLKDETGSLEVCLAADLVVGISTSLLVEAHLASCPVLSILPNNDQKKLITCIDEINLPYIYRRKKLKDWLLKWYNNEINFRRNKKLFTSNPSEQILKFLKNAK